MRNPKIENKVTQAPLTLSLMLLVLQEKTSQSLNCGMVGLHNLLILSS